MLQDTNLSYSQISVKNRHINKNKQFIRSEIVTLNSRKQKNHIGVQVTDEKQTHEVDFENSRKHPEDKIESIFFVIFVIFGYLSLTTNVINLAFSYRCEII